MVKQDDRILITNLKEVVDKFKNTFTELNKKNRNTIIPEPDITINQDLIEPTDEEIEQAIQMLKNEKSPGYSLRTSKKKEVKL